MGAFHLFSVLFSPASPASELWPAGRLVRALWLADRQGKYRVLLCVRMEQSGAMLINMEQYASVFSGSGQLEPVIADNCSAFRVIRVILGFF